MFKKRCSILFINSEANKPFPYDYVCSMTDQNSPRRKKISFRKKPKQEQRRDTKYVATCFKNTEEELVAELKKLGAAAIQSRNRAVSFYGDKELLYKANIWLRTALRVLKPIHNFNSEDAEDLYNRCKKIAWEKLFKPQQTFAIDYAVYSDHFKHDQYTALKMKDAIVDRFRVAGLNRPKVDRKNAEVKIHLHIDRNRVTISLDSSGAPLFKRGYREEQHRAPMNECLAAALLMKAGWKGQLDFLDPMCGSGTLAIEAALMAANIPPNLNRVSFAFEHWEDYDASLLSKVLGEAKLGFTPLKVNVWAKDREMRSIRMCRVNVTAANMRKSIQIEQGDFFDAKPPVEKGFMIMNPPYDQRLKTTEGIEAFYQKVGTQLKHHYIGWQAWIISAEIDALKQIGLKPKKKIPLMNGKLACELRGYELFSGKRKDKLASV